MPQQKPIPGLDVAQEACSHLRSKGMYITGQLDPRAAENAMGDGHCWCNKTQHVLGPDDGLVERPLYISGRRCYQAVL